jgi:hypothetical protein
MDGGRQWRLSLKKISDRQKPSRTHLTHRQRFSPSQGPKPYEWEPKLSEARMSEPCDGQRKMPYAWMCHYRTRTAEGLARSRRSRWRHGLYSAEALAERKRVRELLTQSRELLKQMKEDR